MKKLFTLVVAMFALVLSASAKDVVDLSAKFENSVVNFGGAWTWNDITLATTPEDGGETIYKDESKCSYLCLKYSAGIAAEMKLIVQYEPDGDVDDKGNDTYYQTISQAYCYADGGLLWLKLDADHAAKVSKVAFQNTAGSGKMVVSELFFGTEDEFNSAKADADAIQHVLDDNVLKTGFTSSLAAGAWGWDSSWLDIPNPGYKTLVLELTSVEGKGKFVCQGKDATGADVQVSEEAIPATETPVTYAFDISKWSRISQFAFQNVNKPETSETDGASDVMKTTMVISKVYITTKTKDEITSGISNAVVAPKANVNAPIYNLAGQQVSKSYKGVVIQNGKKFVQK